MSIVIEQADKIEIRPFTQEDIDKFENALDFLFFRGYQDEILKPSTFTEKSKLVMVSAVRASERFEGVEGLKFGDIMVRIEARGGRSDLSFWKPAETAESETLELEEIPVKDILALPIVDKE